MNIKKVLGWLLICSATAGFVMGCSEDDSADSASTAAYSYNGPGSSWNTQLNTDGTCVITKKANYSASVDLTINCTYSRLSTGFLKFTVSSASGTDAPSSGDTAWAVEVPGFALMLVPIGGDSSVIAMVESGSCPSSSLDGNWVIVKKMNSGSGADASDNSQDWWGTFSFNASSGAITLPMLKALDDAGPFTSVAQNGEMSGTCSNGVINLPSGSGDATMYLSDNGAIVHTSVSDADESSYIFGLKATQISNIAAVAGDYACILFDDNQSSGDKMSPVACSVDNSGNGTCSIVTNIETGATSGSATLNMNGTVDAYGNGWVTGEIDDGTDDANDGVSGGSATASRIACTHNTDADGSGRGIFTCVGASPGDNTKMFNVLCSEKTN